MNSSLEESEWKSEDEEESDEDDGFEDDHDDGEPDQEKINERAMTFFWLLLCCCVLLAISAAVLGILVFGDGNGDDDDGIEAAKTGFPSFQPSTSFKPSETPSSTPSTTFPSSAPSTSAPTTTVQPSEVPSIQPTISVSPSNFVPERIEFIAQEDNYITNSRSDSNTTQGRSDVLEVHKGPDNGVGITESFSLLAFNISELPPLDDKIYQYRQVTATLQLTHLVRTGSVDAVTAVNMTTYRLYNLPPTRIEDLTIDTWLPDTTTSVKGNTFVTHQMNQTTTVNVDVTDLLFPIATSVSDADEEQEEEEEEEIQVRRRRRRHLMPEDNNSDSIFIIQITRTDDGTDDAFPNQFSSRESASEISAPLLTIQLTIPSETPSASREPSEGESSDVLASNSPSGALKVISNDTEINETVTLD